jgi:uracil phosphoribosyltransferase
VRNVRSAGEVGLKRDGETLRLRTVEIPLAARDSVIAAYRDKAGKTVDTYWKQLPDASDHPVFRLDPA